MASRQYSKVQPEEKSRSVASHAAKSAQWVDRRLSTLAQRKMMHSMLPIQREEKKRKSIALSDLPEETARDYMIASFKKGKFVAPELDENGKVMQRVVRGFHDGGEYFAITKSDLNTGTGTSTGTRNYVNHPSTPKPSYVEFDYLIGSGSMSMPITNVFYADNPQATNSYSSGSYYDAGHKLASQNGGKGDVNDWVFPQNPAFNQGNSRLRTKAEKISNGKTYPVWRAHEQHFHNEVKKHGAGVWWVAFG